MGTFAFSSSSQFWMSSSRSATASATRIAHSLRHLDARGRMPPVTRTISSRALVVAVIPFLVASAIMIRPVELARRTTAHLDWPHDADQFRDIAQAQTFRDQWALDDPYYLGETIWYNPLLPGVVAILSAISGEQVHIVYVRAGPYLNLLAPLGLFAAIGYAAGPWTAVAALFVFVFLQPPQAPAWTAATYSPWLFPGVFAQSLFYFSLVAYQRALVSRSARRYVGLGLLWGLCFLGHTAPALVLGCMLIVRTVAEQIRRGLRNHEPGGIAQIWGRLLAGLTAFVVAMPLVSSVLGRYHLRTLNPEPTRWGGAPLALENLRPFLSWQGALVLALAILGLVALARQRVPRAGRVMLSDWGLATIAIVAWAHLVDVLPAEMPTIIPRFHFLFYAGALVSVFAGLGLAWLADLSAAALGRLAGPAGRRPSAAWIPIAARCVLVLALALAGSAVYPSYKQGRAFVADRAAAWQMTRQRERALFVDWARTHTSPHDVFLCTDDVSLFFVGPAGRKVVAVDRFFSNPYVDWSRRAGDRDRMLATIRNRDASGFKILADRYRVRFIVLDDDHSRNAQGFPGLEQVFAVANASVWRRPL